LGLYYKRMPRGLCRARGDDQDGRRILVADIVAQSPPAVKVGGCFAVLKEGRCYHDSV
jgi:hypothetical protein